MSTLTTKQKEQIIRAINRGFSDMRIAEEIEVRDYQVREFRRAVLEIPVEAVTKKKYEEWRRQIESGVDIEVVADRYKVKSVTIKQILYREFPEFSLVEVKQNLRKREMERNKSGFEDW